MVTGGRVVLGLLVLQLLKRGVGGLSGRSGFPGQPDPISQGRGGFGHLGLLLSLLGSGGCGRGRYRRRHPWPPCLSRRPRVQNPGVATTHTTDQAAGSGAAGHCSTAGSQDAVRSGQGRTTLLVHWLNRAG